MPAYMPSRRQALATVHAALEMGVTLLDTANCYSGSLRDVGANERLIAEALESWSGDRDAALVATKGGRFRDDHGRWLPDARPQALVAACDRSLVDLGVEQIGLYQLHAPDPAVPFEDSIDALDELRRQGKIARIGLSNVTADQVRAAAAITPVASVQNALSPSSPHGQDVIVAAGEVGAAFLAWAPLDGVRTDEEAAAHPEFLAAAETMGISVRQLALAWERSLAPHVIPLFGARSPTEVAESVVAADLQIGGEILALLPGHRT